MQNTSPAAAPLSTWCSPEMRSCASRLSSEEAELENLHARSKAQAAGASLGVEAAAATALVGGLLCGAVRGGGPDRPPLRTENEIDISSF